MSPIIWLNEHDLVLMVIVQRSFFILLDGEMENSNPLLHQRVQIIVVAVICSDKLSPPEAELRRTASWYKYGRVVNGHRYHLLGGEYKELVPKWCWCQCVSVQGCILVRGE